MRTTVATFATVALAALAFTACGLGGGDETTVRTTVPPEEERLPEPDANPSIVDDQVRAERVAAIEGLLPGFTPVPLDTVADEVTRCAPQQGVLPSASSPGFERDETDRAQVDVHVFGDVRRATDYVDQLAGDEFARCWADELASSLGSVVVEDSVATPGVELPVGEQFASVRRTITASAQGSTFSVSFHLVAIRQDRSVAVVSLLGRDFDGGVADFDAAVAVDLIDGLGERLAV